MRDRAGAIAVHLLTASGAILGLLSLNAAADARWEAAFAWLGAALLVDGADGPLARKLRVEERLPRFSGVRLDLVIDYFTYAIIPAFVVARSGLVPDAAGLPLGALILIAALYHFSDTQSKTADGFFIGFPAAWNICVLYLFVFALPAWANVVAILVFAVFTFVPMRWVHPLRAVRLRPVTIALTIAWLAAAALAISSGFPGLMIVKAVFLAWLVYVVTLGLWPVATSRTG